MDQIIVVVFCMYVVEVVHLYENVVHLIFSQIFVVVFIMESVVLIEIVSE